MISVVVIVPSKASAAYGPKVHDIHGIVNKKVHGLHDFFARGLAAG